MKNTLGSSVSVTLFGESHGAMIGAVLDGLAPAIKLDEELIRRRLEQRRPHGKTGTARREADAFQIVSGAFNGYTTGTPLTILIPNENAHSGDYAELFDTPRPSHADYAARCKYHGYEDARGGGHFSGRITAALVAAGAIAEGALAARGIRIGTHVARLHGICDRAFGDTGADVERLSGLLFPTLDEAAGKAMQAEIERAAYDGDSVGGVLETAVLGMPTGVGEPFFDTLEGVLAHALFAIPAIKGVAFGAGFGFADMRGSEANDPFTTDGAHVATKTNNSGGINGGISNGMPITISCAVKPTPSIFREQTSVSLGEMKERSLTIRGRHDPAIIHRARPVVDAVTALVLADMLAQRYGTDYLAGDGAFKR